jgi:hypothetical protein
VAVSSSNVVSQEKKQSPKLPAGISFS